MTAGLPPRGLALPFAQSPLVWVERNSRSYYLSYLGLPKDNSPWKHFLLSLVFFKMQGSASKDLLTDINGFHLSDVWTIQSNLKDAAGALSSHLPLLGLTLDPHF